MKFLKRCWDNLKLSWKFTISILVLLIIPVAAFGVFSFHNMEREVIAGNTDYMQSVMEKSCQTIGDNVEAVDMTTLFVLRNKDLMELLRKAAVHNNELTTEELRQFNSENIGYLQQMLNSNPSLYEIRVFDGNDSVQEMMPVLYHASRKEGQQWGKEECPEGWYWGFQDSVFQIEATAPDIAALVTPVNDYLYGEIGTIEVSIEMDKMFPDVYDKTDDYYGCFIDNRRCMYHSDEMQEQDLHIANAIAESQGQVEEIRVSYEKKQGRSLIVGSVYLKSIDGTLVLVCDISGKIREVHRQAWLFVVILVVLVLIMMYVINQMVKSLLKRFYGIIQRIRQRKSGEDAGKDDDWGADEIGELGSQVNDMIDEIERLIGDNYKKDVLAKNAELKALHNQINAHFLYNVLGAINMIAEIDGEEVISNAVVALGDMMHYSLKWDSEMVEVRSEIKYIQDYIALTNIRYDHQILLQVDMPETMLDFTIPKMILQPIVENSVKHGLKDVRCDMVLEIHGVYQGGMVNLEIRDHGCGITPENLEVLRKKIAGTIEVEETEHGHGVAMRNIEERLRLTYGENAGLEVASEPGVYTSVTVKIPEKSL